MEVSFFVIINILAMLQTYVISIGLAKYIFPAISFNYYPETVAHAIGITTPVFSSFLGHKYLTFRRL